MKPSGPTASLETSDGLDIELNPDHCRSGPTASLETSDGLDIELLAVTTSHNSVKVQETSVSDGDPTPDSERPEKIHAVPIHRRPDLLVPCADLVNSEWRRSQAARVHSLQKSSPEFPVCLVLLRGSELTERLLGHARLSRVIGHGGGLFIESVVVSKAERGKGYGRTLMEEAERYAKRRGFKRLYLTTHDKQRFYAHLGYVLSTPVQNAGAMTTFVPMETLLRFSRMPSEDTKTPTKTDDRIPQRNGDWGGACVGSVPPVPPPPPPPVPPPSIPPPPPSIPPPPVPPPPPSIPPPSIPPPPPSIPPPSIPPPPPSIPPPPPSIPPPPPPPPPPSQSAGQKVLQTLTETPYRDIKGDSIFWMHKDI
ncbi:uncharacterized protein naa80 [Diretmus argenteus]